jgi:hypothetical protein
VDAGPFGYPTQSFYAGGGTGRRPRRFPGPVGPPTQQPGGGVGARPLPSTTAPPIYPGGGGTGGIGGTRYPMPPTSAPKPMQKPYGGGAPPIYPGGGGIGGGGIGPGPVETKPPQPQPPLPSGPGGVGAGEWVDAGYGTGALDPVTGFQWRPFNFQG